MRHKVFKYILVLLVLILGCKEEPQNTASFRLGDVMTGWEPGLTGNSMHSIIYFDIENIGSEKISTLDLSFTFRTGGTNPQISAHHNDMRRHYSNIPAGESLGRFSIMGMAYDSNVWTSQLEYLQTNRSRPPTIEVRARINGGAEFTYDTFDIFIP